MVCYELFPRKRGLSLHWSSFLGQARNFKMGQGSISWDQKHTSVLCHPCDWCTPFRTIHQHRGVVHPKKKTFLSFIFYSIFCSQTLQNQYRSGTEESSFPHRLEIPLFDSPTSCTCFWTSMHTVAFVTGLKGPICPSASQSPVRKERALAAEKGRVYFQEVARTQRQGS